MVYKSTKIITARKQRLRYSLDLELTSYTLSGLYTKHLHVFRIRNQSLTLVHNLWIINQPFYARWITNQTFYTLDYKPTANTLSRLKINHILYKSTCSLDFKPIACHTLWQIDLSRPLDIKPTALHTHWIVNQLLYALTG